MRHRDIDPDRYRIQKRQFQDNENLDEHDEEQIMRNKPRQYNTNDRPQRQTNGCNNNRKIEWNDPNFLRNFIKPDNKLAKDGGKTDFNKNNSHQENRNKPSIASKTGSLYRPENIKLKQNLDRKLEQYNNQNKKKDQGHQQNQKRDQPISRKQSQIQDIKPIQLSGIDNDSDWIEQKSDKDRKTTLQTNKKLSGVEEGFHTPKDQPRDNQNQIQTKPKKVGSTELGRTKVTGLKVQQAQSRKQQKMLQHKSKRKDSVQQNDEKSFEKSIDILEDKLFLNKDLRKQDYIDESCLIVSQLLLVNEDRPLKKVQQQNLSEAQIRENLNSLSQGKSCNVFLQFQAQQNILQFVLKEVELVQLKVTTKIKSNGIAMMRKYSQITSEQLSKYVTFAVTSHFYPRILINAAQSIPFGAEKDEQVQQNSKNRIDLLVCTIKCPSIIISSSNIDQNVIIPLMVVLRCMECEKINQTPVIEKDYSVECSCHNCSAKILGKITKVWIEEQKYLH